MAAGPYTPTIRGYAKATSLEPTDAFILDRIGVGTMYVEGIGNATAPLTVEEAGVTVTTSTDVLNFTGSGVTVTQASAGNATVNIPGGTAGIAFECGLNNDITIPINNGFQSGGIGNGGWYITFDQAPNFDTAGGVNLSFDYASLTHHTPQDVFYSPSTVYIIPTTGYYQFGLRIYMGSTASSEVNTFGCGMSHKDSTGTDIWDNQPTGQDWQYVSPTMDLRPGVPFDHGVAMEFHQIYHCTAGDIMRPWFQRTKVDLVMDIDAFGVVWWGFKVA